MYRLRPAAWCCTWIGASPSSAASKHKGGGEQGGVQQLPGHESDPKVYSSSHLPTVLDDATSHQLSSTH